MRETAFLLRDPGRPLQALLAALKLGDDNWRELLETVEVYPDTVVDPAFLRDAVEAMRETATAYGEALSSRLQFKYPPVDEDADLASKNRVGTRETLVLRAGLDLVDVDEFLHKLPEGTQPTLRLEIDKNVIVKAELARLGLDIPPGIRPALIFRAAHLAALFQDAPDRLEKWWVEKDPEKLVILAPKWNGFLDGRYLAVVGRDPVEGWRRATASRIPRADGLPDLAAPEVYLAARKDLRWQERFVHHLTPLHLQVEGDAAEGDPVADALTRQFTNLWLLFTAEQSETSPNGWVSVYSREGHTVRIDSAAPDYAPASGEAAGARGLSQLLRWAYSEDQRFDQLSFLQIAVARALYQSEEKDRFGLLLQQAGGLWSRIQPDWKLFMEGRLGAFSAQVRALEDDVAGTVRAFSEQIGGLIKGLSDSMLAAVGVLLGGFIATLFKYEMRAEILTFAVTIYALYVLVFPLSYNMTDKWQAYGSLLRQFKARRERFEGGLSAAKVREIVGDHVAWADLRFRRWFVLVVVTYLFMVMILFESIAVFWLLLPSPIDSVAYSAPAGQGLKGAFRPNTALRNARVVGEGELLGAEDVAVDSQGRLYTGTADGRVMRITLRPGGGDLLETYAETGGRPLGLRFGPDRQTLFVADANKGLLAIDPSGEVRSLATQAAGVPFRFTNDLDVAPDGTIYFSDASSRFGIADYLKDLLDARPHGRLLSYGKDGVAHVLLGGLVFANGVALSQGGDFALVAETYRYRILRYWLAGPRKGTSDVFLDGLPGFPDNLSRDPATGHFWVALYTVRNAALNFLHPRPWLKNQLAKLPRFLWPKPDPYGLIFEVDAGGHVLRSLQDPGGQKVRHITSVEPSGSSLYLGSLDGPVAVWSSPKTP